MSERYLEDFLQDTGYDSSKTLVLYDNKKNLVRHNRNSSIVLVSNETNAVIITSVVDFESLRNLTRKNKGIENLSLGLYGR